MRRMAAPDQLDQNLRDLIGPNRLTAAAIGGPCDTTPLCVPLRVVRFRAPANRCADGLAKPHVTRVQ
jgi:hypothetical protein